MGGWCGPGVFPVDDSCLGSRRKPLRGPGKRAGAQLPAFRRSHAAAAGARVPWPAEDVRAGSSGRSPPPRCRAGVVLCIVCPALKAGEGGVLSPRAGSGSDHTGWVWAQSVWKRSAISSEGVGFSLCTWVDAAPWCSRHRRLRSETASLDAGRRAALCFSLLRYAFGEGVCRDWRRLS